MTLVNVSVKLWGGCASSTYTIAEILHQVLNHEGACLNLAVEPRR